MSVGIRELRNNLRAYLDRVRDGEEVTVTDRGRPVAVIRPPEWQATLDRLVREGRVTPASKPRTPIDVDRLPEVRGGSVADILIEQRGADY